ncbi:putative ATP dependent RNA helicase [Talaromyces proteolyticus]|uniref:ATP-dependent RNA helicase n=1 Tax=Talaromyces proteolyticus TaxID=1131652 RepID=A0AAD4L6F3_9EURO|nr:putative ATP dependent RNA helicase [Talaromyces proteolyticus]KAH8705455.1 putative ATP dependent RNA helicase [Talaromyces proteolyticus]
MADDGMLLNFSIGDSVLKPETKFRGGSWRDRLSAKKVAQGKRAPRSRNSRSNGQPTGENNPNNERLGPRGESGPRPNKRQKTEDEDFRPSTSANREPREGAPGRGPKPKQIISSLFSFNPTPKDATEEEDNKGEGEEEQAKPSNAPLIDGIEDFTALGLGSTLAAHLLTKMELKAPTAIQKASIPQLLKEDSDAFIQAQTGSGKTLAYLLPLVERIMALRYNGKSLYESKNMDAVHRDSGLFAIVLAPTRELCKQISVVLENLLRCAHWIVAGTVIGGEKKKSEKARLRKGLNILVATPGRLADHLDNTQVLDVSNVRWLVLDEGDRLMDLGFEDEIQGIMKKLDTRQRQSSVVGLPEKRTTVLCSATLKMNVQRLGEISLKDAVYIKAELTDEDGKEGSEGEEAAFTVPAQLKQSYVVAASKLRLVTLTALMKRTFARKGSVMKAIVFVSCADSVEFHFEVFTRKDSGDTDAKAADSSEDDKEEDDEKENRDKSKAAQHGTIRPATAFSNPSNPVTIYKLHGSLQQYVRTSTLGAFAKSKEPAVLICTDVASRGLDLPNVDLVVEYDPAFSSDEHLHRIGRTARLGRDGRAMVFLLPGSEENYVEILKKGYRDGGKALTRTDANELLKRGFGGNTDATSRGWEAKATDWQLDVERWSLEDPQSLELARKAFQSHIRAYATHVAAERSYFNIKELHLGHLAKAFALRDRPSKINVPGLRQTKDDTRKDFKADRRVSGKSESNASDDKKRKKPSSGGRDNDDNDEKPRPANSDDAARKMRSKMRELAGGGAGEFNLA